MLLAGCDNKPDAPFGFKWGQTVEDIKKESLPGFKVSGNTDSTQFIVVKQSPEVEVDADYFLLFLSPSQGLDGVNMFSKGVDSESFYFNEGKSLYGKLSSMLEEKYGKPVKVIEKVEKDGDDFYFCLQEKSCGSWSRWYEKDGVRIELSVKSTPGDLMASQPKGLIEVAYEYQQQDH